MPVKWKLRIIRKKYAEGLPRALTGAIYNAYSEFNRRGYNAIMREAPINRRGTVRFPAGFVKSQIQLVTKKKPPYEYQEVDVPGKYSRESRAWRAWLIIKVLHDGWTRLPFERRPTRKRAMGLPVYPGSAVPRPGADQLVYRKVTQRRQITLNPFIMRAWRLIEPQFTEILNSAIEVKRRERKTERETIR